MRLIVLCGILFSPALTFGTSPSDTIIVAFGADCQETIQYLKAADQLPDVKAYREKICNHLTANDCDSVLELGCGLGTLLNDLAMRHPRGTYLGIDHNPAVIDHARSQKRCEQVRLQNTSIDVFFEKDVKFSAIIIERVLHCLNENQINSTLGHCIQALIPGGKLIIVAPDFKSQQLWPHSRVGNLLLDYMQGHTAATPISPENIRQKLDRICSKKNLSCNNEICKITTRGFKETNDDLCLEETAAAAVRDQWIHQKDAAIWLEYMQLNTNKVLGISDMYIFVVSSS